MTNTTPLLSIRELTKRFTGITAVDHVSFDIGRNEIHALIGENGAGKSTLCKMLTGAYPIDEGYIEIDGQRVDFKGPADSIAAGINMVYQERNLIGYMTAAQNVCLGSENLKGIALDQKAMLTRAEKVRSQLGADVPLDVPVEKMGAGAQQLDTTDVVPEGKDVTVTADIPEGAEFLGWSVSRADGEALDWTPARDDPQTITFTMPDCNVTVTALCQGGNDDIDNPSGGGSSDVVAGIAAVALTGAAVWGIYETGTGIYRVLNMPGVPMPSNRAGLATLIWEKAGCPEPQTVKSFSDIDDADLHLRQAASWMEEQGLMDDVKENEFRPYRYVTKLQTCLVWDKAKEESLIS